MRAIGLYERVCDSALLDRLVRGRLWIGLLACSLIGLVAMQLMVLKLNNGIGATLARAAALQRSNAQLGIEAATGTGEGRVEPLAAATGMVFAAPGSVHFVAASPAADVARAAAVLAAPIQPREYVPPSSEASGGTAEASTGEASAGAGEASGSGEASAQPGETAASSGTSEAGAGGSGETSSSPQAQSTQASAAPAPEPETSASAAGGVAAGH